jgi:hypothetical protein
MRGVAPERADPRHRRGDAGAAVEAAHGRDPQRAVDGIPRSVLSPLPLID